MFVCISVQTSTHHGDCRSLQSSLRVWKFEPYGEAAACRWDAFIINLVQMLLRFSTEGRTTSLLQCIYTFSW